MTNRAHSPASILEVNEQVRIRIAIADDHDVIRAGLRALLSTRDDIDIIWEATSHQQICTMIDVAVPDILLLDPELGTTRCDRLVRTDVTGMVIILLSESEPSGPAAAPGGAFHLNSRAGRRELDRLIDLARSPLNPPPPAADAIRPADDPADVLILALVAAGRTNRQIARQLGLGEEAVKRRLRDLFARWKVGSRSAAVVKAIRLGIIE